MASGTCVWALLDCSTTAANIFILADGLEKWKGKQGRQGNGMQGVAMRPFPPGQAS